MDITAVVEKTFSVLTVSKRTDWEADALESICRNYPPVCPWVIVTEHKLNKEMYALEKDVGPLVKIIDAPESTTPSNLNKSLNAGLKVINTDYVIFYQDFIDLPPDCFKKLLALADDSTFVTTCTPNYDGSNDSRYLGVDGPRPCRPEEWETNVALAPMKMIRALGGFDETYDNAWSWDNVSLAARAAMLGAQFIIDESNRPKLLPHEQTSKLKMGLNADWHNQRIADMRSGKISPRLDYLG